MEDHVLTCREFSGKWSASLAKLSDLSQRGLDIEERRKQSTQSRKKLGEDTRSFFANREGEWKSDVEGLVKAYQQEIDILAKRAKNSETLFLQTCRTLYELPEPLRLLNKLEQDRNQIQSELNDVREECNACRTTSQALQSANDQLSSQISDLEEEFTTVRNQAVTVRRLEEEAEFSKVKHQREIEELLLQRDEEWAANIAQLREEHGSQVALLKSKISEADKLKRHVESQVADAERHLLQVQADTNKRLDGRALEVEALSAEIERLQSRKGDRVTTEHDVCTIVLQKQIATLNEQITEMTKVHDEALTAEKHKVNASRGDTIALQQRVNELREELQSRPTQREVDGLRSDIETHHIVSCCDIESASTDLERRLLQRQQQLEGQCAKYRVDMEVLENKVKTLHASSEQLKEQISDCRKLNEQLEGQLAATQKPLGGLQTAEERDNKSMLHMIMAQRERFRQNCMQAEQVCMP
eukprot:GHVQ01025520.1.p1 GENE.GHVQ01025520.1~~GHVQ01025520.1.p1  ORF type:complete len:472 (+),score=78.36 GHVQ01025520.1:41-1456(+)